MLKKIITVAAMVAAVSVAGTAVAAGGKAPKASRKEVTGVININTASAKELQQLPGVGKKKAEGIVAYRLKTPFKTASEITKVKGFSQKVYARLQQHLSVSGPTTLKAVKSAAKPPKAPQSATLVPSLPAHFPAWPVARAN